MPKDFDLVILGSGSTAFAARCNAGRNYTGNAIRQLDR